MDAPWKLNGEGILLTYSFKRDWLLENGFVPAHMHHKFKGGLSFVMLVNYTEANCGPYRELLFIPGLFKVNGRHDLMITKIYVDSEDSLTNGRKNWGIPKELADIEWKNGGKRISFNASKKGNSLFRAELQSNQLAFPVNNNVIPFKFYQELGDQGFTFKPKGKGKATMAKVNGSSSDPALFPDLSQGKLMGCMHVKDFSLTFPKSEIKRF